MYQGFLSMSGGVATVLGLLFAAGRSQKKPNRSQARCSGADSCSTVTIMPLPISLLSIPAAKPEQRSARMLVVYGKRLLLRVRGARAIASHPRRLISNPLAMKRALDDPTVAQIACAILASAGRPCASWRRGSRVLTV